MDTQYGYKIYTTTRNDPNTFQLQANTLYTLHQALHPAQLVSKHGQMAMRLYVKKITKANCSPSETTKTNKKKIIKAAFTA